MGKKTSNPALQRLMAKLARQLLPARMMKNKDFFELWQEKGYHVTPVHFYEPIPDTRALGQQLWDRVSELPGIDINERGQLELLERVSSAFRSEYELFPRQPTEVPYQYHLGNDSFGAVDAEMLYSLVRFLKPARVLEIGSGYSTLVSAQAALKNEAEGRPCRLTAVEPYPRKVIANGFPGLAELKPFLAQQVPPEFFDALGENDILFIDSSHVLAIGSDVQFLFLEVLPRLAPGVVVHVHDIFLPAEYPREWVIGQRRFFNEQYLLQAFLAGNKSYQVMWGASFMHLNHPAELAAAFPSYAPDRCWPGSFWMRRTA